jgi:gliding motility-associated-like protein
VPKLLFIIGLIASVFMLTDVPVLANRTVYAGKIIIATPQITASITTGSITACQGTASADPDIQQFVVSGSSLTGNVIATAPANFEISLSRGSGYGSQLSIAAAGGILNSTTIYVRSASSALFGKIYGNVVLSSPGAADNSVGVVGTIKIVPMVFTGTTAQEVITGTPTGALTFAGTGNVYTWTNDTPSIGLAASGSGNIPSFTAINTGSAPVTATITVTPQHITYAYIGNQADNTISVIDISTNTVVKTLSSINHAPTGFAVSNNGTRVFVTNGYDEQGLSVIDPISNTQIQGIGSGKLASAPIGITVSPDGKIVYFADSGLHGVYAFEPVNGTFIASYTTGGNPISVTITADGSKIFVTNSSGGMWVINTTSGNITPINVAKNTYGSCISPDNKFLYVTVPGSNNVLVYDIAADAVVATIPVGTKPEGINISPDGKTLYVTNNGSGNVSVISTLTNTVVATVAVGVSPYGICPTSDGKFVYVTNQGSNSVSVINTANNTVSTTIAVGNSPSSFGNFILPISTCPGVPSTFSIKVDPKPLPFIAISTVSGAISSCEGSASANPDIARFSVSGGYLTAGVTVTAPSGFQISLNPATGYGQNLALALSGATVSGIVYIRSAANAPSGNISGNIVLTSSGATDVNLPVSAVVYPLPIVDKINDQTVLTGNTTTAITFTGTAAVFDWINDTPSIGLPASGTGNITSFTAINNSNLPVTAKITVVPKPSVVSGNTMICDGAPVTFTITVIPTNTTTTQNRAIPNTFTPNGDGVNDTWEIGLLNNYPNCIVSIYNRWGQQLYRSVGYPIPWNGTYKGKSLPVGTYYYIIHLKSAADAISGWVSIIK